MKTPSISGSYVGDLRCQLTHLKSKVELLTDAPTDNEGKGEAFSPTDLVAAALGSCMLTIIGIRAKNKKIDVGQPTISVVKEMANHPRKIKTIIIEITFNQQLSATDRDYLESEARKCPVALSLNESINQETKFNYV